MRLEGIHHVTMITGDAQRTVDFHVGVLGLRLVKTTVNFDQPEAYHLYLGDEAGSPGSILTWFEFAGAAPGQAGAGMVHRIVLAVRDDAALGFWRSRLADRGVAVEDAGEGLRFTDPDGLGYELAVDDPGAPLRAAHPEVPAEHAITGVAGVRIFGTFARVRDGLYADVLGFDDEGEGRYVVRGHDRSARLVVDDPPDTQPRPGAGTVHHVAWASRDDDHGAWRERVATAGGFVTPQIDRDYFHALYFREQHGVLFEIATLGPGFAVDEDPAHLGEELRLPTQHESRRSELAERLSPLVHPRSGERVRA